MSQPPELWTFVGVSVVALLLGATLFAISFGAYRRQEKRSILGAIVGFGSMALAAVIHGIYVFGIKRSYVLGGREFLQLQTVQGLLLVVGLTSFVYSLSRY